MHKTLIFCLLLLLAAIGCAKPAVGIGGIDVGTTYVQVDIHADRDCVKAGEVVKLRAVATNRGETTQVISLEDSPSSIFALRIPQNLKLLNPTKFCIGLMEEPLVQKINAWNLLPAKARASRWIGSHKRRTA